MLEQGMPDGNDDMLVSTPLNEKAHYVYPRFRSWMLKSTTKTAATFADGKHVKVGTVSNILSGKNGITDKSIEFCQDRARHVQTPASGEFIFNNERMVAETFFEKKAIAAFINNRAIGVVAEELGIDEYLLAWIAKGQKISIELAERVAAAANQALDH